LVRAANMGKIRGTSRILVGKPEVKGPSGKPRRRWRIILKSS
jgi:hypothetical protein